MSSKQDFFYSNDELSLTEVNINREKLESDFQQILDELDLNEEELKSFVQNAANFTPDTWERLQNEKKLLQDKLQQELSHVKDPIKTKRTLASQKMVLPHWIFVR